MALSTTFLSWRGYKQINALFLLLSPSEGMRAPRVQMLWVYIRNCKNEIINRDKDNLALKNLLNHIQALRVFQLTMLLIEA